MRSMFSTKASLALGMAFLVVSLALGQNSPKVRPVAPAGESRFHQEDENLSRWGERLKRKRIDLEVTFDGLSRQRASLDGRKRTAKSRLEVDSLNRQIDDFNWRLEQFRSRVRSYNNEQNDLKRSRQDWQRRYEAHKDRENKHASSQGSSGKIIMVKPNGSR